MYKRALRRYQKDVKHKARLKKYNLWFEVKENSSTFNKLKTMSTICSCWMCAYGKYDRVEQKKKDRLFLKLGFDE